MATLQQLLDAQSTVDWGGTGDSATIVNPLTGKRERGIIGFTAPGWDAQSTQSTMFVPESLAAELYANPGQMPGLGTIPNQFSTWTNESNIPDFLTDYGPLLVAGLPALVSAATGAGLLPAADGALAGSGAGSAGSFLGSPTGSVLGPAEAAAQGVQIGSVPPGYLSGPTLSGVSSGAGPFVPTSLLGPGASGAVSSTLGKLLGTTTGGAASGAAGSGAGTAATGLAATLASMTGLPEGIFDAAGKAIPGLVGAYAANEQANSLTDLAKEFSGYGAPSRARYEASMTPGFDPTSIPGYSGALDSSMDSMLRRLSARDGNPWGSPGGLIEANKAIVSGTALPAIQEYQRTNAGAGGLDNLAAAYPQTQAAATNAGSGVWGGFGDAAASIFTPKPSLTDIFKQFKAILP